MEVQEIMAALPRTADRELVDWAERNCTGELGGEFLIYASERVEAEPTMQMAMDNCMRRKKVWASRCSCTACGDDFITQKITGADGIYLYYGDDGCTYMVDPRDSLPLLEDPECGDFTGLGHGDAAYCPLCGREVELLSAKWIRGGRTKRIQIAQLLRLGEYAAIVYWLVSRKIDEWGIDEYDAEPRDAFVLGEKGDLLHFGRGKCDFYGNHHSIRQWETKRTSTDAWYKQYHDWGSVCDKKRGSLLYPLIPSLVGTTGEKTGLHSYWSQGCSWPAAYLKTWKRWPSLENLVNAGHGNVVERAFRSAGEDGYDLWTELRRTIDPEKRRPHEMLGLTKEEYKRAVPQQITWESLEYRNRYRAQGFTDSADRVLRYWWMDKGATVSELVKAMKETGDTCMDRYLRYLEKQGCRLQEIRLLTDCRRMTLQVNDGAPLTQEELWPRRLIAAHDRIADILRERVLREEAAGYQRGFDRVLEQCSGLEWTDGELCVRIPRCNEDLVQEGRILRHCVGGYGKRHSEGKNLIFFIRHYRRPERSYYTLNISMGLEPAEIQLHGYGNERHGERKQYTHSIPKKVRQFCDRWEREILTPYCQERYKNDKKEKTA